LDFTLIDRGLVTNVLSVKRSFAQRNLKHSHDSCELEVIESFFEGLVLIVDGDVGDLVDLVKTLDTVLNELGELNS